MYTAWAVVDTALAVRSADGRTAPQPVMNSSVPLRREIMVGAT
ncbi:MAG TPA: hypothetical protein VGE11_12940 [Pseudonocardia sp.]